MENKNNTFALTMESGAFNALKSDFNQVLRRTLSNMEKKESEQAELTLKLKISLEKDVAPDFKEAKYRAERDIIKPTFTHKISSVMQYKCEKSGVLGGDYELVWNDEIGDYIIRPIDNGQMTLFDDNGEEKPQEPLYLEAATVSDETETQSADIIEADYKEVEDIDIEDVDIPDENYDYEEPNEEAASDEQ